jgi:hypothetical protein
MSVKIFFSNVAFSFSSVSINFKFRVCPSIPLTSDEPLHDPACYEKRTPLSSLLHIPHAVDLYPDVHEDDAKESLITTGRDIQQQNRLYEK